MVLTLKQLNLVQIYAKPCGQVMQNYCEIWPNYSQLGRYETSQGHFDPHEWTPKNRDAMNK